MKKIDQAIEEAGEDSDTLPRLDCGSTDDFYANSLSLTEALQATGLQPVPAAGGYFLIADCSPVSWLNWYKCAEFTTSFTDYYIDCSRSWG